MKTILTLLFFVISIVVFSMDSKTQNYLLDYYKTNYINLTYGIENPKEIKLTDFSNLSKPEQPYTISENTEAIVPFAPINDYWYVQDFAEEPFDGKVEVTVVGEPLPSTTVTLFLASILVFTVLKSNKLHKKGNVAYEY